MKFIKTTQLVILVSILSLCSTRLIKPKSYKSYKQKLKKGKVINLNSQNSQSSWKDRHLTEGSEDSNVTMKSFKYNVALYVQKCINTTFGNDVIKETSFNMVAFAPNTSKQMLQIDIDAGTDTEIKEDVVEVKFTDAVSSMKLTIGKTNMKDLVKMYIKVFMNNYLFKVKNNVNDISQLETDLSSMLRFCTSSPAGVVDHLDEEKKDEERILNEDLILNDDGQELNVMENFTIERDSLVANVKEEQAERLLMKNDNKIPEVSEKEERALKEFDFLNNDRFKLKQPIMGEIRAFPLDLKNKRYSSIKPEIIKKFQAVEENYEKLKREKNKRDRLLSPARKLVDEVLPIESKRFLHKRLQIFKEEQIKNRMFLKLALVGDIVKKEDALYFRLVPSRRNLAEIKCSLHSNSKGIQIFFDSESFSSVLTLSIPTKRFVIKHLRNELDNIIKLLTIIDNLNEIRAWVDTGATKESKQIEVKDLIQPSVIYMMFRKEFDNISNGQLETPNPNAHTNRLQYHVCSDINNPDWWFDIYDTQVTSPVHKLAHNDLAFEDMKDFPIMRYTSYIYTNLIDRIGLGPRWFPDASMFNQHYLTVRYMDLQVQFAVKSMRVDVPRDHITPYPVEAMIYHHHENIPTFTRYNTLSNNMLSTSDIVGSPEISSFVQGIEYHEYLCPIYSEEFDDYIYLMVHPDGRMNYEFKTGRGRYRRDVDYCVHKTEEKPEGDGDGGEERRLLKTQNLL